MARTYYNWWQSYKIQSKIQKTVPIIKEAVTEPVKAVIPTLKVVLKKSKRNIKNIVWHCSATREGQHFTAKDIDKWHRQRGWSEIGYNYVVLLDGTIEIGRNVNRIPAHVRGYNKSSIACCYIGGVDKNQKAKDTRTDAQKETMLLLTKGLSAMYINAKIKGHRDFPKVAKACPCFDAIPEYADI